jgi:hypothetical protein
MGNEASTVMAAATAKSKINSTMSTIEAKLSAQPKEDKKLVGCANKKEERQRRKERETEFKKKRDEREVRKKKLGDMWEANRKGST